MNKRELTEDLKSFVGAGFITRKDLARFMNRKDPHGVDKYLVDLERQDNKYYFIRDVAESILNKGGYRK